MDNIQKTPKRIKDKSNRATFDTVLDQRTLNILQKLSKRELLKDLTGCISKGKEANVYCAMVCPILESKLIKNSDKQENTEIQNESLNIFIPSAIKIYQTSIMQFKDRLKYIQSEKRFETFCNTNPRKLTKLWAEKEVRNLNRLQKANIPSPKPIYLKNNILIMTLITDGDKVASKLKDYPFITQDLYNQAIGLINDLYNKCNLVHSDFSEYNILVKNKTLYVIDMGQAVEKCHDNSDEFLIKDIININTFFARKNIQIENVNDIYEKVSSKRIPECLRNILIGPGCFVPGSITEVVNSEDYKEFLKEEQKELEDDELCKFESEEYNSEEEIQDKEVFNKEEMKLKRKDDKKAVKELQREKRKNKIPKKEKKKREKLNKKRK